MFPFEHFEMSAQSRGYRLGIWLLPCISVTDCRDLEPALGFNYRMNNGAVSNPKYNNLLVMILDPKQNIIWKLSLVDIKTCLQTYRKTNF